MIKTKEDFKGKYIELPSNLSEKKFNMIKTKFNRLGFNTNELRYKDGIDYYKYIEYSSFHNSIGNWDTYTDAIKQISIKDFLREEENNNKLLGTDTDCIIIDELKESTKEYIKKINKIINGLFERRRKKETTKIKSSTLSMLSKTVKDAIRKKTIVLYAQDESFSEANLGAKYVLELGDSFYTLAGNGSTIFFAPKISSNTNYKKDDIVELED